MRTTENEIEMVTAFDEGSSPTDFLFQDPDYMARVRKESEAPMNKETTDKRLDSAKQQGQAQYENIQELVLRLKDTEADQDAAREAILEHPLSVRVRTGWHQPAPGADPDEFEILLCTGGPAVRLIGTLNQYCEPETCTMQVQDWSLPWMDYVHCAEDVLLTYARCFWFGEGRP